MTDQTMLELCRKICVAADSNEQMALIGELAKRLAEEQDAIKAKIRANLGKTVGAAD
jgi:hypothetical protein